jgi:hypothetical protein
VKENFSPDLMASRYEQVYRAMRRPATPARRRVIGAGFTAVRGRNSLTGHRS